MAPDAEVSLEADPGTFDAASLRGYIELAGVTRLSLGVQSFDDEVLKGCGRSHGIAEVEEALRLVSAERERGRKERKKRRRKKRATMKMKGALPPTTTKRKRKASARRRPGPAASAPPAQAREGPSGPRRGRSG